MKSLSVLALALVLVSVVLADENATTSTSTTTTTTTVEPILEGTTLTAAKEKISRRIIDDRLSPPKEFVPWNGLKLSTREVQRSGGPRVTEDVDEGITDKPLIKKSRNVGPAQEPNAGGFTPENKEKSSSSQNKSEAGVAGNSSNANGGPAPRFHGNRPSDDRYGWRSSSYLGYNKDKGGYYDHRNHYPYDRYSSHRPSSNYAQDGDRYRPGSPGYDGDRFGSSSGSSSSSSSSNSNGNGNRPISANYVNSNYGFGPYGDRPRPGGNYGGGISGSISGDGDADYPFGETGTAPGGMANIQTQKAVALKALAGVALIGAAAALASNPVLLPMSVLTGRRKRRSTETTTTTTTSSSNIDDAAENYALTALLQGYIQPRPNEVPHEELSTTKKIDSKSNEQLKVNNEESVASEELVISPQCVARLACHVHRDYLDELEKSRAQLRSISSDDPNDAEAFNGLERWFNSLIHTNILVADYLSEELKLLIQSAVAVGSDRNSSCDQFSCLNVQESSNKTTPN